ncbi:MAG: protein-L-isoaspartate(D-aspartate) O-methyltransferase [Chloroflexi bacterium]|nr:protein-L-isoaspartate(D-aspartate) O-methyltransferase [Chloroflexota bacterium]MBI3762300.1 protein-L-isoaspartate(D-aspartate) O-methyltransferase [Chloroflexota bacterium]
MAEAAVRSRDDSPDRLYELERLRMVREQLNGRDIVDPRVLAAMREVPRHLFVPDDLRHLAYRDGPLPIGHDQTISQPYIVALMTQLLQLVGTETVLEVGTGSGYQTAVLAWLARRVFSLEVKAELAQQASERLSELGRDNVEIHVGDGSQGLPDQAPFEAVIVTAAAPSAPPPLTAQLAPGGRMVIPIGGRDSQYLERWIRRGDAWHIERVSPVMFVPLVGRYGQDKETWWWM